MIKPSMKSRRQPVPRRVPRRILRPIHARAATREEEVDDYEGESEPNMKFSHALIVVLILHVVAVGGVIAFNMLKTKSPTAAKQKAPAAETQAARTDAKHDSKPDAKPDAKPAAPSLAYSVVAGDTLRKIAIKQKSSVDAIEQANGLESGATLHIGQVLKIPVKAGALEKDPASAAAKTAPAKDPAPVVAKTAPTKDVAPAGKLAAPKDPAPVAAKTAEAKVPAAAPATPKADAAPAAAKSGTASDAKPAASPAAADAKPAAKPAASGSSYTVAKGDNPYSIAKKLNVSYSDLLKANKIDDPKKLQIGQKLIVP